MLREKPREKNAAPQVGEHDAVLSPLVGVWELRAIRRAGTPVAGGLPRACILFTPRGKFIATLADGRGEPAAAFREAFAYCGEYREIGNAWITKLLRSWNDVCASGEQLHFYTMEAGMLSVRLDQGEFEFARLK
jgi:hypothetical protein